MWDLKIRLPFPRLSCWLWTKRPLFRSPLSNSCSAPTWSYFPPQCTVMRARAEVCPSSCSNRCVSKISNVLWIKSRSRSRKIVRRGEAELSPKYPLKSQLGMVRATQLKSGSMDFSVWMQPRMWTRWGGVSPIRPSVNCTLSTETRSFRTGPSAKPFWINLWPFSYQVTTRTRQMISKCSLTRPLTKSLSFWDHSQKLPKFSNYPTFCVQFRSVLKVKSAKKLFLNSWNAVWDPREIWFHGPFPNNSKTINLGNWTVLGLLELQLIPVRRVVATEPELSNFWPSIMKANLWTLMKF